MVKKKNIKKPPDFNDPAVQMNFVAKQKSKETRPGIKELPSTVSVIGGKGKLPFPGSRIK